MLDTARQLSAGMGAPAAKVPSQTQGLDDPSVSGNAPLGLWVGERFYGTPAMATAIINSPAHSLCVITSELYVRTGDGNKANAQQRNNELLRAAVRALPTRHPKPV